MDTRIQPIYVSSPSVRPREEIVMIEERRPHYIVDRSKHGPYDNYTERKSNACWYRVCIGLAIGAVLLCLAIFIPLLMKSNSDTTDGGATKENCYIATYNSDVTITSMSLTEELTNPYSSEYQALVKGFCESLNENMEDLYECGERIDSCRVDGLQSGSVIFKTTIRHTKIGNVDSVSSTKQEKETKRIKTIVSDAVKAGARGSNPNNLFSKNTVGGIGLEATEFDKYVQCSPVKTPRRSTIVSLTPFVNYIDDKVTVQCEKGYYFPDSTTRKTIICLSSEEWSQELFDCEPKLCPNISASLLENSELILGQTTGNGYKDSVSIQCNKGFTFDPNDVTDNVRTTVCGDDGEWDPEISAGCQDFDECDASPCANGGSCSQVEPGTYSCDCPDGYSGNDCETDIDYCVGVTCQNGGTCCDELTTFRCNCAAGYDGTYCDNDIDYCVGVTCQNGGTCSEELTTFRCTCAAGYSGTYCDTEIDECASNPCQNAAPCTDGINGYQCACAAGYLGNNCEVDVDECMNNPCLNDGTCTDGVNGYTCGCPSGFSGDNCETPDNPCQKREGRGC